MTHYTIIRKALTDCGVPLAQAVKLAVEAASALLAEETREIERQRQSVEDARRASEE